MADFEDRYYQAPLDGVEPRTVTRGRWCKFGVALGSGLAFFCMVAISVSYRSVSRASESTVLIGRLPLTRQMVASSQGVALPLGKPSRKDPVSPPMLKHVPGHAASIMPAQKRLTLNRAEPAAAEAEEDTGPGTVFSTLGDGVMEIKYDTGLTKLKLTSASGAEADIYTFGATVTSFKAPTEVLFVRPDAKFDGSKPISGGLPFCWPQFGPGEIQQHGFARNCDWKVVETKAGASPSVTMELTPSKYTTDMWKYDFKNTYTVTVGEDNTLTTTFTVANTGKEAFTFTGALHSYYAVGDIAQTAVQGAFKGSTIFDRMLDPPARTEEERAEVTVEKETDRCYEGVSGVVKIADKANARTIVVDNKAGYADTCVWNPWNEGMGSKKFICVESGNVKDGVTVAAGATWVGEMTLKVE